MTTLQDLVESGHLFFNDGYRTKRSELGTPGFPILRVAGVGDGRLEMSVTDYVHESLRPRIGVKIAEPGDIVLTTKGTVGRVARVGVVHAGHVYSPQVCFFRIRDQKVIDPDYLYYWLRGPTFLQQIEALKAQTDMADYVNLRDLRGVRVELPNIHLQRAIGRALNLLDQKMELNQRTNDTMEGIARAIHKAWFVDFGPIRAMLAGRKPPGLKQDVVSLFPERLVMSEIGEIPSGWRLGELKDEFSYQMGQSPPGSTYNEEGFGLPLYQGKGEFGFRYPLRRLFCTAPTRLASPGDTLVSVRAPVGAMNMAREKCCIGRGLAAVRHRSGSRSYTYYAMHAMADALSTFDAEGTVFGSINKQAFGSLTCLSPPEAVVERFDSLVSPLDDHIELLEDQMETLAALRDALLPRLVSGELRLKDAEQLVEVAI